MKLLDQNGNEIEQKGIDFCKSLFGQNTKWIQTSYNDKFRGKYAATDDIYDEINNIFIGKFVATDDILVKE
jgi:hypothetical protein